MHEVLELLGGVELEEVRSVLVLRGEVEALNVIECEGEDGAGEYRLPQLPPVRLLDANPLPYPINIHNRHYLLHQGFYISRLVPIQLPVLGKRRQRQVLDYGSDL